MAPVISLAKRAEAEKPADRWSPRQTLVFVALTCGGFWGGFAFLVLPQVMK